jgi:hypothetical protein
MKDAIAAPASTTPINEGLKPRSKRYRRMKGKIVASVTPTRM